MPYLCYVATIQTMSQIFHIEIPQAYIYYVHYEDINQLCFIKENYWHYHAWFSFLVTIFNNFYNNNKIESSFLKTYLNNLSVTDCCINLKRIAKRVWENWIWGEERKNNSFWIRKKINISSSTFPFSETWSDNWSWSDNSLSWEWRNWGANW